MTDSLSDALGKFLGQIGIAAPEPADAVVKALSAEAARVGVDDVDVSIRWGRATVSASSTGCARLNWHREQLARVASDASDGAVTDVRITTRRPAAGREER